MVLAVLVFSAANGADDANGSSESEDNHSSRRERSGRIRRPPKRFTFAVVGVPSYK